MDLNRATLANMRLESLWNGAVARWERLRTEGQVGGTRALWDDVTLAIGKALAKGESSCSVVPPQNVASLPAELQVAWLARLQADLPIIPLRLDCPDTYAQGADGIRQIIEVKQGMLVSLGEPVSLRTLHEALDAYSAHIAEKDDGKPCRRPQRRTIALLR